MSVKSVNLEGRGLFVLLPCIKHEAITMTISTFKSEFDRFLDIKN